MATKDPSLHEEQDRRSNTDNGSDRPQTPGRTDARSPAHTEIKNAHATGDGSMGRNDSDQSEGLVPQEGSLK